ncbi:MAG TPA: Kazal-type serine protease inhibitor domain-containing protein, partial [Polyangiaceae bacterium]
MRVALGLFLAVAACGGVIVEGDGGPDVKTDSPAKIDAAACNCGSSQWCKHDATCGSTSGNCTARPEACPDVYAPVCGYDGQVYPNECGANAAGADTSPTGGCIPPAG